MYKNYKIGKDGLPKYDNEMYRVAPERRFYEPTEEWKRRLERDGTKKPRRRHQNINNKFTFKVIHLLYLVGFFMLIGMLGQKSTNVNSISINHVPVEITLNNAIKDFGNESIKPSTGNLFLHVNLNLINESSDNEEININEFSLVDDSQRIYKASYLEGQNNNMIKILSPNSTSIVKVTFDIPISYKNNMNLVYEGNKSNNRNIVQFNMQ